MYVCMVNFVRMTNKVSHELLLKNKNSLHTVMIRKLYIFDQLFRQITRFTCSFVKIIVVRTSDGTRKVNEVYRKYFTRVKLSETRHTSRIFCFLKIATLILVRIR